ncbi:MAG: hypothetical protein JXA87_13775 [Thermoleophilia bacterium]|nr:hypothetical protein [Thermoleophilia bacterium]
MSASDRFNRIWAYVAGGLIVATGLVHDAMIYTELEKFESLPQADRYGSMWLFLCTGTAVAFSGVLNLSAARGLVRGESWARRLTLGSSLFLAVLGVSGLALSQWAASILVALAVLSLVPWWAMRAAAAKPVPARSASREAGAA